MSPAGRIGRATRGGRNTHPARPHPWLRRIAIAAAIGVGLMGLVFWLIVRDVAIPDLAKLNEYHPKLVTRIYGANGALIGELAQERRTIVPIEKIPKVLQQAVVDAEDAEFYTHGGVSYVGMLRALLANLRHGRFVQGGSTITQQVVKTFFLSPERKLKRKIQEVYLAQRLESTLSKDQILWLYLNQIYYGHGRYGCQEAARYYFGKDVDRIDLAEAALLAGLPQNAAQLDPFRHPEGAKKRQTYVLDQMAHRGHIKPEEAKRLEATPIRVIKGGEQKSAGLAPEAVDQVKQLLVQKFGEEALYSVGLDVRTTIDARLQQIARTALEKGLESLDQRENYRGPVRHLQGKALTKHLAELRKELRGVPPKTSVIYEAVVTSIDDGEQAIHVDLGGDNGVLPLKEDHRYNPQKRPPSERFHPGDVVRVRPTGEKRDDEWALLPEFGPQAALVVIDAQTRQIKALVGGYGYVPGSFNRALRAHRQPGSSFKPFLYATAFDSKKYTPASLVNDAPEVYALWKPQNDEKEEFRGPIRLRQALAESINTVAIRLMADIGPPAVIETARRLGIKSELTSDLSLALGASGVTPLEMTNAYATFPAMGKYQDASLVTSIGDEALPMAAPVDALKPEVAFVTAQVMMSVITEGTARSAAGQIHRPVAGKTGTTNSHHDAWFIGFTPDLVAGVWVGFDDMQKLGKGEQGARAALPIWVSFMQGALKNQPPKPFPQPPGVVVQRIDPKSGLLAPPGSVSGIDEYFLEGTAPTTVAQDGDSTENFLLKQVGN